MSIRSIRTLRSEAKKIYAGWESQSVSFQLRIGWAASYDELLAGDYRDSSSEAAVLDVAQKKGRVILSGRAGSGKTWLLRRLYKLALDKGWLPVFIDLKQWSGEDYKTWKDWTGGSLNYGTEYLLDKFGTLGLGALGLDAVEPHVVKVLFVDGLNEITSKTGSEILSVADELAANLMNASVIVADRLIRRELPNASRWAIAGILPLSIEQVQKYLPGKPSVQARDIRTSPFFLRMQMRHDHQEIGRASMVKSLLLSMDEALSESDLDRIAKASFEAYLTFKSRSFETSSFRETAGVDVFHRLQNASILASVGNNSYFVHHILHDYLASRYFSKQDVGQWTTENFRALSFEASSFDALELTFEQLDAGRGELFLRKLYDWNLYAAGYALAELNEDSADSIGKEMRVVIFGMLAEKHFDSILATKERAADALRVIQIRDVVPFRNAASISDLYGAIRSIQSDVAWFNEWRMIFSFPETKPLDEEILHLLREEDSIRGWTASNVIRRYRGVDPSWIAGKLSELLEKASTPTVRWRVAHVLGAVQGEQSKQMLLKLLDTDEDVDVRYGAIRSLVEIAAAGDVALRVQLGLDIEERAQSIAKEARISRELRACLLVDHEKAPQGWMKFVRTCVRSQFEAVEGVADKDLWRGCLNMAEALYVPIG